MIIYGINDTENDTEKFGENDTEKQDEKQEESHRRELVCDAGMYITIFLFVFVPVFYTVIDSFLTAEENKKHCKEMQYCSRN